MKLVYVFMFFLLAIEINKINSKNYKTENFLLSLLSPNLMEDVSLK